MIKDTLVPVAFIKRLVEFPHESEKMIKEMELQFNAKHGKIRQELMEALCEQNENKNVKTNFVKVSDFEFFTQVPNDICASIAGYLDPYSFSRLAQTSKRFHLMSHSDAMHFYFKNLCLKLFEKTQPVLPATCRFN